MEPQAKCFSLKMLLTIFNEQNNYGVKTLYCNSIIYFFVYSK